MLLTFRLAVSESLATLLHSKRENLVGQCCFNYMHPGDLSELEIQMQSLLEGQRKMQGPPYRFKNGNGDWLWMEAVVTNQLDNPEINGIIISGRDISDRIAAEKNAKEMQLLEALREGEEKERSRISRDLHDEISGMMAAAKMHFASVEKVLPDIMENNEYRQGLRLLNETAQQIRNTSHHLMPEALLENGLDQALHHYVSSISNRNLQLWHLAIGDVVRFAPNFELSLYRIAQELINNIIKHSRASAAIIQLSFQPGLLSLTVEDNGIGFDDYGRTGSGLPSIRRRVAAMDGTIDIQTALGKGTTIYLEFYRST